MDENQKVLKERKFLNNLTQISHLDSLITSISDSFNQGLTDIAYLRFKNEILGYSLTARSYSITPAKRVILSEGPSNQKLVMNEDNDWHMSEFTSLDDTDVDNEDKRLLGEMEMKERIGINEQILMKFGITNRDPLIYHAQAEFVKSLEKLIELHNLLSKIGVYENEKK